MSDNMENKPKRKTSNTRSAKKAHRTSFSTHTGHALTPLEAKFIDSYIETGNGSKAVADAGYKVKALPQQAQKLLNKPYIAEEINFRLEKARTESIADATEIMQYFTDVMRGKIQDAFGLDAPLSERTKAAQELAKRQIDIPNRLQGNEPPKLTITVDWGEEASADVQLVEESVDTSTISDLFDTKKRENLE